MTDIKRNEEVIEEFKSLCSDLYDLPNHSTTVVWDRRDTEGIERWLRTILATRDAEKEEAVKRVSHEIVKEFKDILITIAIENKHLRGCVTSNQIIKAFQDFEASEHAALSPQSTLPDEK